MLYVLRVNLGHTNEPNGRKERARARAEAMRHSCTEGEWTIVFMFISTHDFYDCILK